MRNRNFILIWAVFIIFLLTGCSGEDKSTMSKIEEKGEITYALTGAYPPFNYIDENGEVIGFDVDIANALAEKIGVKAKAITTQWDGIIGGLKSKRFDTIIGSMAITEERVKEISFTEPYYYDGAQFFAKADNNYNSISDLKDGEVGVVTGTTFHDELKGMDNIKEILQFESDIENFIATADGRSDGLVTSRFVGIQAPEEYNLVPVGSLLYTEHIAIGLRKEDEELLNKLNKALEEIIADGTYEDISNHWFGRNILEKE